MFFNIPPFFLFFTTILIRLGKVNTISDLPPTIASIKFDILRAFYATYVQINCLNINANNLVPIRYGYYSNENYILTEKLEVNIYPPTSELTPSCNCKTCTTK